MYNSIPKQFLITDTRTKKQFKKKTFNGYKKTEVFSDFQKSILSGNIEKSILWATELHCSGYTENLYTRLFDIYVKEINKANLKLLPIFKQEFDKLDRILKVFKDNNLEIRNEQYVRNHIHNLVCLLTFSPKNRLIKLPKVCSEDFNMNNVKNRMLSKNLNEIKTYIKENDPKNIIIPVSEILLNLKKNGLSKSMENSLFWLNWLLIYEKNYHKSAMKCHPRKQNNVDNKFFYDFTWLLWQIINDLNKNEYIKILFEIFKYNFKKSNKRKKINLIIIAFEIIIDPFPKINFDNELICKNELIKKNKIVANINYQYLDLIFNASKEEINKKIQEPPKKIENKISPYFSRECFGNNSINKEIDKYDKKKKILKTKPIKKKNAEISRKEIFKEQKDFTLDKVLVNPKSIKKKKKNFFTVTKVYNKLNKMYKD